MSCGYRKYCQCYCVEKAVLPSSLTSLPKVRQACTYCSVLYDKYTMAETSNKLTQHPRGMAYTSITSR
jgi:hypothetical protein